MKEGQWLPALGSSEGLLCSGDISVISQCRDEPVMKIRGCAKALEGNQAPVGGIGLRSPGLDRNLG